MSKRQRIMSGEDMQKKTFSINIASLYFLEMGMGESCAFNQLDIAATLTSSPLHQSLCRCFSRYKINSFFLQLSLADSNIDYDDTMQCTLFTIFDNPQMFANMNFSKIASHDTYKGTNIPVNGENANPHYRNITIKYSKFSNSYKCVNVGNIIYGIKMSELTDEDFKMKVSINLKLSVTYGGVRDAADLIMTYIDPHRIINNGSAVPQISFPILCNKILVANNNTDYVQVDMNSFEYMPNNVFETYDHPVCTIQIYKNENDTPLNGKVRSININHYNANVQVIKNAGYYVAVVHTAYYKVYFYHDDTPILRLHDSTATNASLDAYANFTFPFL